MHSAQATAAVHWDSDTDSRSTTTSDSAGASNLEGESTTKVGFNIINTVVGSGIVCLPYALYNAGFVFGIVMLGVIAAMSQFSLYALVATGKRTGSTHFSSVAEAALGSTGYHLLNYSMVIDMVGTVVLYLMIIGDMGKALADIYLPVTMSRASVIVGISAVAILPLLFFRNTGPLARFSIVSVLCLPYIILAVASRAPLYAGKVDFEFSFFGPRVLPAMGVLAFNYSSCHAAFPNYLGLRSRTTKAWVQASSFATAGATAISMVFAVTGYLSFGRDARANILENFPSDDNAINLGRLLFVVSLVFTVPMGFYPIRDTVTEMLKIDPERHGVGRGRESACTLVLFGICVAAATLCTDLGLAYELIGTLSSSVVNFLLPALVFLWAGTNVSLGGIVSRWRNSSSSSGGGELGPLLLLSGGHGDQGKPGVWDMGLWLLAWSVAAFGVWVMVLGTFATLAQL